ncbi:hypothetical protein D3C81_1511060 [compost metagenome]
MLLLAAGEVAATALFHLQQHREQLVDEARHAFGLAGAKARQAHQQVLLDAQAREDLAALGHVGDAGVHPLVRLECGDRLAFPVHAAFAGGQQAHQAAQQGGLADAVTAEQAGDFTDPGLEGQAAQDVTAAVVLVQGVDFQHV